MKKTWISLLACLTALILLLTAAAGIFIVMKVCRRLEA